MREMVPRKRLGQHFLKSDQMAARIAKLHLDASGSLPVLEVGPGMGSLTRFLLKASDLQLVELDDRCILFLLQKFGERARVVHGDFLEVFPADFWEPAYALVGNFPYNISSQIVVKMLDHKHRFPVMTGMFQLEVARRLAALHGSREYGILSVLLQAFYHCQIVLKLAPGHFDPPPAVHSAVIQCIRKEHFTLPCSESFFRQVVRVAFGQRRKVLRNTLGRAFPVMQDLPGLDIYSNRRAEELSWEDFVAIASALETKTGETAGS